MKANKMKAAFLIGGMLHAFAFGVFVLLVVWINGGEPTVGEARVGTVLLGILWLSVQIVLIEWSGMRKELTENLFAIAIDEALEETDND